MRVSGDRAIAAPGGVAARRSAGEPRYLYGRWTDFLGLGGASLLLAPVLFVLPQKEVGPAFAVVVMALSFLINYPHFAFSYQVFYEGFNRKAFGPQYNAGLRARYIVAGIVVPLALVAFLAGCMMLGDAQLLGHGANLMALLVGWHYTKQGYGMLMVDAALKRQFFNDTDKKVLLVNSYAVWAFAWLKVNTLIEKRELWDIEYYTFDIPPFALEVGAGIALATTVLTGLIFGRNWRANGGGLPMNGVVAYVVSLYLWLVLMHWNALWLMAVPALHSLQYILVVMRYRTNRFRDESDADAPARPALLGRVFPSRHWQRSAGFVLVGMTLGYLGFWGVPSLLQAIIPYDQALFGSTVFLFVFWIFINVHHYFLDNVMWRSENPDVRKYLFA